MLKEKIKPAEYKFLQRRFKILIVLLVGSFAIFALRLFLITLVRGEYYRELSENNFLVPQRLEAPRGTIFDRNHLPVGVCRATFSLYVSPFKLEPQTIHQTLSRLSSLLNRDISGLENRLVRLKPKWQKMLVAKNLSLAEVTPILEDQYNLPGLIVEEGFKRYYPAGQATCHISGYLGMIPKSLLPDFLDQNYDPKDVVGIVNIEQIYESSLHGNPGEEVVRRDARGRKRDAFASHPSEPGNNVFLTLDLKLQEYAYQQMQGHSGTIIAMDPSNGAILAMVSCPGFDPNDPESFSEKGSYFLNKAIQENYPPGSTFKLITTLAALHAGISPEKKFFCEGKYYLPNWNKPFTCFVPSGHGWVNMRDAIKYSCNVYFYQLAEEIGAKRLVDCAFQMGLGSPTRIDLSGEVRGYLPLNIAEELPQGEVILLGIGQGRIATTPLQILNAYCAFANGGRLSRPHLLEHIESPQGKVTYCINPEFHEIALTSSDRNTILQGLVATVNEEGGTAYKAGFHRDWKVAGKTGTAQRDPEASDAWFVGFAPYDNPELAVLVLVEKGGHGGTTAAPLAKNVFGYYFANRNVAAQASSSTLRSDAAEKFKSTIAAGRKDF
jgi:penicillin-binding protein 2